ncbi:MAG: hypothetical protein FWE62_03595 [Firmicutes bacterium]|nr:hypothetical protein [Bacillota bacterium]
MKIDFYRVFHHMFYEIAAAVAAFFALALWFLPLRVIPAEEAAARKNLNLFMLSLYTADEPWNFVALGVVCLSYMAAALGAGVLLLRVFRYRRAERAFRTASLLTPLHAAALLWLCAASAAYLKHAQGAAALRFSVFGIVFCALTPLLAACEILREFVFTVPRPVRSRSIADNL